MIQGVNAVVLLNESLASPLAIEYPPIPFGNYPNSSRSPVFNASSSAANIISENFVISTGSVGHGALGL